MEPVTAVMVGAGQRGYHVYGEWALRHPDRLRFVAVAEPDPARRERFAEVHAIPTASRHAEASELLARRHADACVIASPDRHHHEEALAALDSGYHTLLEKPMASTIPQVEELVATARMASGSLHIAHVLRFAPFFQTLHRVVVSGRLGEVVTVEHRENISAAHMAHSYVRGNWGRSKESTPMIVAKCCHDLDILWWNLAVPVRWVASFGSQFEFRPERAPVAAPARCTDGCPEASCPYDARRIYLDPAVTGWPVHVLGDDLTLEGRLAALANGPYGRCVFRAGCDVVDHQVVAMELEDGRAVSLHMHGHSGREERTMRYDGTRATLRGRFGRTSSLEIVDHVDGSMEEISIQQPTGGHGGGDGAMMEAFCQAVIDGEPPRTGAEESWESYLVGFLAEEARVTGQVVDVAPYRSPPHS